MWYYQSQKGNAGQNNKPLRLKDLEDHSIKSLVREFIQNSLDVKLPTKSNIILKFKVGKWDKADIQTFKKNFSQKPFDVFSNSYAKAQEDAKIKMSDGKKIIDGQTDELFYLTIEEYNCLGLTGSVNGYDDGKEAPSNFNSLMRMIDDNEKKKENPNSGGTWGKGSSVFAFSSSLWMWFSYSQLSEPWTDKEYKEIHKTRFMGRCAIAPFFQLEGKQTLLGEGWFCQKEEEVYPYINDEADSLAESLGLKKRNNNPGTTFFIPFFNSFITKPSATKIIEEFKNQILQNWFIPIYDGKLIVELEGIEGIININAEYIKQIPQLKYKLEILDWYRGKIPKHKNLTLETFHISVPKLLPDFKRPSNAFAMVKHNANVDLVIRLIDEEEDFSNEWHTENQVALTRNKGMIVNHYSPFETKELRFESILFTGLLCQNDNDENAKKHLDLFLAYSENPSHNKWCRSKEDYPICFLEKFDASNRKPENIVNGIFAEIGKIVSRFIVKEKFTNTNQDICSIFKKLTQLKTSGGEKSGSTLFFMRKISEPIIDANGRYIFNYRLISNVDQDIKINFKGKINSLEGEKEKEFNILGIEGFEDIDVLDMDEDVISSGPDPSVLLNPNENKVIFLRTCPIDNIRAFKNVEPIIKATANLI